MQNCINDVSQSQLIDKELILANSTLEDVSYSVYNVFLSRWLENQ